MVRLSPPPASGPSAGVVLFDGTCAFCESAVKFIATRDPEGYFRFGASQTAKGTALLATYGMTRQASRTLILIEDGQVYQQSTASLRIARRLRWPWSLLGGLLIVPRPLRDPVYRLVAGVRHQLAGKSNACEVPPAEIRARLI